MNFRDFFAGWDGVLRENRLYRFTVTGLICINILTALAALRTERSVILVPPGLTEETEVSRNRASQNFKEAWGMFVAQLLGNVTPGNVEFVRQSLSPMLSSGIYRSVMSGMAAQIEEIKREQVSLSFNPKEVLYEPETDKVFVTGMLRMQGPGSKPVDRQRTYEMVIDINDYRPLIRHIDAYPERPRTLEVLKHARKNQSP